MRGGGRREGEEEREINEMRRGVESLGVIFNFLRFLSLNKKLFKKLQKT